MFNLVNPNFHSSYELHKIQEESLRKQENDFLEEKNFKVKLTYERALSELYNLSKMPEYKKYFHPMLGLSDQTSYPKVLGAWMDKIDGNLKLALVEDMGAYQFCDTKGSIINFSINEPHEWKTIEELETCNPIEINENYKSYHYHFNANNFTCAKHISFHFKGNIDTHPTAINPQDAIFTHAGEFARLNQNDIVTYIPFHKIDLEQMEHIDLAQFHESFPHYEKSDRHFLISYDDIKTVVNQPSNPFQMGGRVKSAASSLNSIES